MASAQGNSTLYIYKISQLETVERNFLQYTKATVKLSV